MANPRAIIDNTEICSSYITKKRKTSSTGAIDFLHSVSNPYPSGSGNTTQFGQSATIDSTNDQVKVGAAGDYVAGRITRSEADGMVVIQDHGYATFPFTNDANAPVLDRGVVCDGSGGVRIAASIGGNERGVVTALDVPNLIATVNLDGK